MPGGNALSDTGVVPEVLNPSFLFHCYSHPNCPWLLR